MLLLVFYSCDRNKKEAIDSIVKKWMGKEILFPENSSFITYDNRDSVDFLSMKSDYRIVTYVNSETCFSCNLRLPFWKGFVMEVDSVSLDKNIPVLSANQIYPTEPMFCLYLLWFLSPYSHPSARSSRFE